MNNQEDENNALKQTNAAELLSLKETQNHGKTTQDPLLSPQTGTATSSPNDFAACPTFKDD